MTCCFGRSLHCLRWSLCLLWCMISLRPCPGDTICETSDPAGLSLLQVSTQLQPSPWYKWAELPVSVGWDYILLAQHKAGWEMCDEAATGMQSALADQPGASVTADSFMPFARSSSEMRTQPACFLHVIRNPFEMLVSGYLYHMAQPKIEPWLSTPFGLVADAIANETQTHGWQRPHLEGVAHVFNSSLSGSISARLPDAKAYETYPEYLTRVDLDAGLIAEFTWASNTSLESVLFTDSFLAESQPCSITVCLNEFYENCNATWQRVLNQTWEIPDLYYDGMFRAATRSCPAVSHRTVMHSSDNETKAKGITHAPEFEMVKRLRELDRLHLGGTIAALEGHNKCPVSGKYLDKL